MITPNKKEREAGIATYEKLRQVGATNGGRRVSKVGVTKRLTQGHFKKAEEGRLTRNNVAGIHRILVFDEAETVHQLHLGDFPGAMSRKVCLDIGLGSCREKESESVGIQGVRRRMKNKGYYGPLRGRLPK